MVSSYELQRLAKIAKNNAKLAELGLLGPARPSQKKKHPPKKSKRSWEKDAGESARRSARTQQRPPEIYAATHLEDDRATEREKRRQQVGSGFRGKDGRWRGERFGAVPGVSIGDVFGAGDLQRKGRFEMSESGFHVGHVQPEYLDSTGAGCYSLILNNDNGSSRDDGDRFTYAGAGGRKRGQNRTAQQSFDQSWESQVNDVLRRQCANQKPVRVIRGPKLRGRYSTALTGGGYRYDGLYRVAKAEMVRTGSKALLTCMFMLERL